MMILIMYIGMNIIQVDFNLTYSEDRKRCLRKGASYNFCHYRVNGGGFLELVSKELNHFGGIASFFRDWALGTLTGGA